MIKEGKRKLKAVIQTTEIWRILRFNLNYSFGKFPESNYKISLRTFFGNPESEVFSIRFDENDNLIAASNSDGSVKIFNLATGINKIYNKK